MNKILFTFLFLISSFTGICSAQYVASVIQQRMEENKKAAMLDLIDMAQHNSTDTEYTLSQIDMMRRLTEQNEIANDNSANSVTNQVNDCNEIWSLR